MSLDEKIQNQVEQLVFAGDPTIEVLLAEVAGGGVLRVFIDHPDGVTLEHCERVTHLLGELRERYAVEVSSPGPERPLTRPEHFIRYSGRRARLKLVEPVSDDDRRTISGEIIEADTDGIVVVADGERFEVAYRSIGRANLIAA